MKADYIKKLKNIDIDVTDPERTSNEHQLLICRKCSHTWTATPKSKIQNYNKYKSSGCPLCTKRLRYIETRTENVKTLKTRFKILDPVDYGTINNNTMLQVKNLKCKHIFTSKFGNLLNRDIECPSCNTEHKRERYRKLNEERHQDAILGKVGYAKYSLIVNKLTRDSYRHHTTKINPDGYIRSRSGQNGYHLDHIISKKYCFGNNIPPEICAHPDNLRMIYWKDNAEKWKKPQMAFPDIFSKYITSYEKIKTFISYFKDKPDISVLDDSVIKGYSLSVVNATARYIIHFLTLNEHLEKHTGSKNYCSKLQQKATELGYKFIAVFEDEWDYNRELVLTKLSHYIGQNNMPTVGARLCTIKEIDVKVKNKFLEVNHIQGLSISQINLGAFHNNVLVAVMTFCKPRILMNKKIDHSVKSWELARFATDNNFRVVGIASKLLKYFKSNYEWDNIYSYADKRWSGGNLYNQLGFTLDRINPPDYYYIIDNKRMHRWGFRKDAIREKFPKDYDPNITEYQNMLKLGYDRVWDCGTLKFILNK